MSQNAGNSETQIFKIFMGRMPPDPPRKLALSMLVVHPPIESPGSTAESTQKPTGPPLKSRFLYCFVVLLSLQEEIRRQLALIGEQIESQEARLKHLLPAYNEHCSREEELTSG